MQEERSPDALVADPEMRSTGRPPVSRWRGPVRVASVLALLLAAAWGWLEFTAPPHEPATAATPAAPAAASAAATASAPTPATTASARSEAAPAPPPEPARVQLPALDESDLVFARWLEEAFGRDGLALLRINDFARRFVATVDNLGREQAPARLWPVNPAAGAFATVKRDGRTVIDPDNALRYAPFVILLESADPAQLAAVYRRAYPLLQQAYEELGYPGQSFHARLLAVIAQLRATPEPAGEIALLPVEVQGAVPLSQPWRYLAFADPALQQLPAGPKLLLRMGLVNERRLKQVLARLQAALTAPATAR